MLTLTRRQRDRQIILARLRALCRHEIEERERAEALAELTARVRAAAIADHNRSAA